MNKTKLVLITAFIYSSLFYTRIEAVEGAIFSLRGDSSVEKILNTIGAPKGSVLPVKFNNGNQEIYIETQNNKERIIILKFSPPLPFIVKDNDHFLKIEVQDVGDRVGHNLLLSDPKSGRMWRLTLDFKVSEFQLVAPWESKEKLSTLKEVLAKMKKEKNRAVKIIKTKENK